MERLKDVKRRLKAEFTERVGCGSSVHAVTFKSPTAIESEDRLVVETTIIKDQSWAFLAVFDGHSGSATAHYASQQLPRALSRALKKLIDRELRGHVDHASLVANAHAISMMLQTEIRKLDDNVGLALKKLCDDPKRLTRQQAMQLIDKHEETIERAFQGTTVALALINVDNHLLWAAGLGNSTVALSIRTIDNPDVREADRLCELHTLNAPGELARLSSSHPSEEVVDDEQRLMGLLPNVSRALGDFHLKYDSAYLDRLFSCLPRSGPDNASLRHYSRRIKSPPYVSNEASVRFVDYGPGKLWERRPILMLFTEGVDRIVNGYETYTPGAQNRTDPADVVTALLGLSPQVKTRVEDILGHGVEIHWSPSTPGKNRAVDILGNILGGTNIDRLNRVVTQTLPAGAGRVQGESDNMLDLDDTTIVLCDLTRLIRELRSMRDR